MCSDRRSHSPLQRADFHYELPPELIAQVPLTERGASRLLTLDGATGALRDLTFADLPSLLAPGDLLVRNDTRVLPARLRGQKDSGGKVEILVERVLSERRLLAQLKASKATATGRRLLLPGGVIATVAGRSGEFYELDFEVPVAPYLERHGEVPLPPYIARAAVSADRERYQTVYARQLGAVAAPTAGLHFAAATFERLAVRGVELADLTLHVGAGTFQPVRVDNLDAHQMHAEWLSVPAETIEAVRRARARGGRVVALGTTVLRALETAAAGGEPAPCAGETRLFIRPGYRFRVVDALLTNFHLPESTLLMLVAAYAGHAAVFAAYRHAVARRYRFFSYGDAMFVTPRPEVRQ
jgi:S-adenosylmethionine:tRNA ribosyltransferase-isomerase